MEMKTKKTIKRYIKEVKKQLRGDPSACKATAKMLKQTLYNVYYKRSDLTIYELYDRFGSPVEIANSFYQKTDVCEIREDKGWLKRLALVAGIVTAVVIIFGLYVMYKLGFCGINSMTDITDFKNI